MQLELKDLLISPFYFKLDNKGRKKIFSKINTDIEKLAKKIGCSKYTLKIFQNNYRFIRYDILKKLLILSNLNTNTIEKHVISVKRGCSNREVEINLPIKTSPELANLIAKGLGDGGISLDNRFFYTNQQIELINEVISNTNKAIGKNKHTIYFKNKSKCYEMKFSSVIGFVLNFFGVPIGYKIGQKVDIPIWIKEGNKEIKKMFIRGLFDDEACVNFIKSSRSRRIIFSISKRNKYAKSLTKFLKSLQDLLNEFKIKSNSISIQNKSEDKIVLRFTIQNKESLENYKKQIYFTHPKKRETLEVFANISQIEGTQYELGHSRSFALVGSGANVYY